MCSHCTPQYILFKLRTTWIFYIIYDHLLHNMNILHHLWPITQQARRSHYRMVVRFTTTCAISGYHRKNGGFESRSCRCVLDITLCDKVFQWLVAGRWFSPVSSTNKTDIHDITEILLKVALNTITLTLLHRIK